MAAMHATFTTAGGRTTLARPETRMIDSKGRQYIWLRRSDDGKIVKAYLHGDE